MNFFALHHLDPEGVRAAISEWYRVLQPGGQLILATWEGRDGIDYGDASDIVALRYRSDEIASWVQVAGFAVTRCIVEPIEEIPMDAIYLEGARA
jgi:ubiquinone/menaquinone biosynthesis C-methylase UbiE